MASEVKSRVNTSRVFQNPSSLPIHTAQLVIWFAKADSFTLDLYQEHKKVNKEDEFKISKQALLVK